MTKCDMKNDILSFLSLLILFRQNNTNRQEKIIVEVFSRQTHEENNGKNNEWDDVGVVKINLVTPYQRLVDLNPTDLSGFQPLKSS